MKWLIRIVVILVLLVAVGAVAGVVMMDSIATRVVKEGAAFATQTDAECEKVDIKVFGSSASITNLDIKNPDGPFRDKFDSFMVLGEGSAAVSAGSVMSDMIEIPKVELTDIEISLVGLDDNTKNFETILESLKRFQGDKPEDKPEETKSQKKIVIRELIIKNITVKYDFAKDPTLGALPVNGTVMIADKNPMVIKDLGDGGIPTSELIADIITDILVQVTANLAANLGDHVLGLTGSLADTLGADQLKGTFNELGLEFDVSDKLDKLKDLGVGEFSEGASDAIKKGGDAIKEGLGGLGGLIGGGDKKEEEKGGE